MGEIHELVDLAAISRLFTFAAIGLPLAGAVIGAVTGGRRNNTVRGMLFGLLCGSIGILNWLLWHMYNVITDRNGLDTVKNLAINLALFILVGVVIGVVAARIQRSPIPNSDAPTAQSEDSVRTS